jgi:hypothetical protein
MTGLGVVFTWIAISAASAKGLAVFVRAAATAEPEADLLLPDEAGSSYGGYPTEVSARRRSLLS